MANTHAVFQGTHCAYWDIDAYTLAGVAETDLDNGTFVTVGDVALKDGSGGFEVKIAVPAANATGLWVCRTPEVGTTLDMQLLADPRNFYNKAGDPVSIAKIQKDDYITVTAPAFATAPTASLTNVSVNASGKLVAQAAAPTAGTAFVVASARTISIGLEEVPAWLLKCTNN